MKPSKGAMELAEALFPDFTPKIHVGYADVIQSALSDLLEKAESCATEGRNGIEEAQHDLIAALEPWKPEIISFYSP